MAKARITSKSGALITVEGSEKEVAEIIRIIEQGTPGNTKTPSTVKTNKRDQRKRAGASDLVMDLNEDGFFSKPKSLTDIAEALEEKGYLYPVTTLSGVMLALVKKKLLGRKKVEGKWVYGK
jgi:hypothetical protein